MRDLHATMAASHATRVACNWAASLAVLMLTLMGLSLCLGWTP